MGGDRDEFSAGEVGYRMDMVTDPDLITVRRRDGSVLGRFSKACGREEIERAIAEDGYAGSDIRTSEKACF
jgi:hypothetical protein